jgi:hypothetical protein
MGRALTGAGPEAARRRDAASRPPVRLQASTLVHGVRVTPDGRPRLAMSELPALRSGTAGRREDHSGSATKPF